MVARGQAYNPYWSYENAGINQNVDRIIASASLGYDITDWLNLTYKIGFNNYNQAPKDFIRSGTTGADGIGRVTLDNVSFKERDQCLMQQLSN